MARTQLFNITCQHIAHLIRIVTIHDQHDTFPKKWIFQLICAFFQRQQTIFTGDLRKFNNLVDHCRWIELFLVENNTNMPRKFGQHFARMTCNNRCQGAAKNNEYTGSITKVSKLCKVKWSRITADRHTQNQQYNAANDTQNKC